MNRSESDGDGERNPQRDKVLKVAAGLFAAKGFGGAGMREIAREAGVSLSMINYYFGSKRGVLEELLERHQDRYLAAVTGALQSAETVEGKVKAWVRAAVTLARHTGPAMKVIFVDLPREAPGVLDQKAARMQEVARLMATHVFGPLERLPDLPLLGPALGSAVMSHFMARPMLERVLGELPDDDAFFERYAAVITHQLLYGLVGRPAAQETHVGRLPPAAELPLRPGAPPPGERG